MAGLSDDLRKWLNVVVFARLELRDTRNREGEGNPDPYLISSDGSHSAPIQFPKKGDPMSDTEILTSRKLKRPSMYAVVFLNDDYTPMEFVVGVFQFRTGLCRSRGLAALPGCRHVLCRSVAIRSDLLDRS